MNANRSKVSILRAAACAGAIGAALALTGASASASLVTFELVATGGNNAVVDASGKSVSVTGAGATVNADIIAVLHSTDATQTNDGLTQAYVSVFSGTGGLLGNLAGTNVSPFNLAGIASPGTPLDTDIDTDFDLGADRGVTSNNNSASQFVASSSSQSVVLGTQDVSGDLRMKIGSVTFTVTGSAGSTTLQVAQHTDTSNTLGRFQKFTVDNTNYSINGNGSGTTVPTPIDVGAAITVTAAPEPGSLALLGLGGLGLLLRRRRAM